MIFLNRTNKIPEAKSILGDHAGKGFHDLGGLGLLIVGEDPCKKIVNQKYFLFLYYTLSLFMPVSLSRKDYVRL
jgi:hypothetical protein